MTSKRALKKALDLEADLLSGPLDGVIASLQRLREGYGGQSQICLLAGNGWVDVELYRLETDEEARQREEQAAELRAAQEQREYQQYLLLKAKFERRGPTL